VTGVWVVLSVLLGSIPFGLVVAGVGFDVDPRREGSGNIGATNVARTVGNTAGAVVLALDLLKGVVAAAVGLALGGPNVAALAGAGAVLGHCWSIFLAFRGGKGVATACGVLLVLTPWATLAGFLAWVAVFAGTRRSSLGALAALPVVALASWWLYAEQLMLVALVAAVIVFRHAANIRRLASGDELDFRR
jgi:acyl phosphate:glycerol-3-phosphate acyltransferase